MTPIRTNNKAADILQGLLQAALQALDETTGIGVKGLATELPLPNGRRADARITFKKPLPAYLAEIKREMTPGRLGPLLVKLRELPPPCMLITRYVTPPLAEKLHALDIQFLDTVGNAYLHGNKPYYHIYITGRKPAMPIAAERPVKAFRAAGLRVIFPLLCVPDAINAPYRVIADMAGVALGTVAQTMAELIHLGLLRETKTGRIFQDRDKCIDNWVDAYPRELRPRLKPRRFLVRNPDWWKKKNLAPLEMWLGGEAGAAVLTKYLRPEVVTLYGNKHFGALAREIRPVQNEHGNLEVLDTFWRFIPYKEANRYRLAPALLIYADLLATTEARNLDVAAIIRERYLGKE